MIAVSVKRKKINIWLNVKEPCANEFFFHKWNNINKVFCKQQNLTWTLNVWRECGGVMHRRKTSYLTQAPACKTDNPTLLWGWAKNASALYLPKNVGFEIGSGTRTQYLVLQVHFKTKKAANRKLQLSWLETKLPALPVYAIRYSYTTPCLLRNKREIREYIVVLLLLSEFFQSTAWTRAGPGMCGVQCKI